jgi:hypothetical protein
VCDGYGVPYVATRGFRSVTLHYESAQAIMAADKPAIIFYFGDHDASGQSISDGVECGLRQHGAAVTVRRVALNPAQISVYGLQTRPGKWTDSRQVGFAARLGDASVELDALPPDALTGLVERSIEDVIDAAAWQRLAEVEALERRTLASLALADWKAGVRYAAPEVTA